MTDTNQKQLGNTLWSIADQLRGAMDADDFRDLTRRPLRPNDLEQWEEPAAVQLQPGDFHLHDQPVTFGEGDSTLARSATTIRDEPP